ncbi:MAG: hypothetical protein K1X86_00125 [Ignavibacteria bacterium]|nr:hypothetical protein [Ignavibacteria bacterium]
MNKKSILLILLTIFPCRISFPQSFNEDQAKISKAGITKCIIGKSYYKFGEPDTKKEEVKSISYINGYKSLEFFPSGKIRDYDYDGNTLIQVTVSYYDEWNNEHSEIHKFEYDQNNNPEKEQVYSSNGTLLYKTEYKYFVSGNIELSKVIEKDGEVSKIVSYGYTYYSTGRKIFTKSIYHFEDESAYRANSFNSLEKIVYLYNDDNLVKEEQHYFSEDLKTKHKKVKIFYNSVGLTSKKVYYDLNGEPEYEDIYEYK